jgi:cytochrome b6-f complex iron-sulfur subunit
LFAWLVNCLFMQHPRRRFIKFLTFGTASSFLGGALWRLPVMAVCTPLPGQKPANLTIRLADYPALAQEFGSVRLGINPITGGSEPFPNGNFYPILVNRDGFGNYHVLDTECKHASCVVPAFDSSEFVIRCPCHGSEYDIDGSLVGGPADFPLTKYPSQKDAQGNLNVQIPCWGFDTALSGLPGGPQSRLRLNFPTFPQVVYEVSFGEKPGDAFTVVPFSLTEGGPANQTSLAATGAPASLYVDRSTPTGFFAVGMKLQEI